AETEPTLRKPRFLACSQAGGRYSLPKRPNGPTKEEANDIGTEDSGVGARRSRGARLGRVRDRKPERRRHLDRGDGLGAGGGEPRPGGRTRQPARGERGEAARRVRRDPREQPAAGRRPAHALR